MNSQKKCFQEFISMQLIENIQCEKGNFAICKRRMQKQKHAANEERKGAPVQCALRSSSDDERARLRAPRPMTSEQVHSIYIYC